MLSTDLPQPLVLQDVKGGGWSGDGTKQRYSALHILEHYTCSSSRVHIPSWTIVFGSNIKMLPFLTKSWTSIDNQATIANNRKPLIMN